MKCARFLKGPLCEQIYIIDIKQKKYLTNFFFFFVKIEYILVNVYSILVVN